VRRSSRLLAVGSSVVLCLVLAACVLPASAQLCVGSIAGTVTDSSGAVVAVAHVTATDAGFTFARYHRQHGHYLLRDIPPGRYSVSAEAAALSIFQEFPLRREGMHFEYRREAFNAFNHPHVNGPDAGVGSSTYGSPRLAGPQRQVQMALKFYW
jgi:hypothetical protein